MTRCRRCSRACAATFALDSVALLRRADDTWIVEAGAGEPLPPAPHHAQTVRELNPGIVLAITGPSVAAEDQLILNAFADQLAAVLEHRRLSVEAGRAHALADANELRGALLQAVSHDLRTPLASIKACATSLKQRDVEWSESEKAEFVDTIDTQTDRLTTLVSNLLDMSRVQAGVVQPVLSPTPLDEVVAAAIRSLGPRRERRRRARAGDVAAGARRPGAARAGGRQRRRQRRSPTRLTVNGSASRRPSSAGGCNCV